MDRTEAIAWVLWICQGLLRKSQAKTLSVLVAASLTTVRLSLAGIGRELASWHDAAAKHAIKRAWRFVVNRRIEPVELMPLLLNRLWRRKLAWHAAYPRRRPLLVSIDWTKIRRLHCLMAAVVVAGRGLPFCWQSYRDRVQGKSQNVLEYALLLRIKASLRPGVRLVILADRGFGRAALIQQCQRLGLDYLVRIAGDVIVRGERFRGNLQQYPLTRGACQGWREVAYRSDASVNTNLILRWKKGLPAKKDQPWYLLTNLPLERRGDARRYSDLYALRFDIEELFRDGKNEHLGWSLAKTRITRPDRLDRLILILALAYLLLVALGLWCRQHCPPRTWASNNRPRELSAFAIGRVMLQRLRKRLRPLLDLLYASLATPTPNWG